MSDVLEYFVLKNSFVKDHLKIAGLTFYWSDKGLCRLVYGVPKNLKNDQHLQQNFGTYEVKKANAKHVKEAKVWLQKYSENQGDAWTRSLSLDLRGTPFQKSVWKNLLKIPYGRSLTYGEIAHRCSRPKASRAVGSACGANPLSLVVPCHRVLASSGRLGGFAGGLPLKKRLLNNEGIEFC